MTRVYLDTETTGLDYNLHRVVELSWAVEDGPIKTIIPPHSLDDADPRAMKINRYFERGLHKLTVATAEQIEEFLFDVQRATIVGANPRFDATMITNSFRLAEEPWHYRLLDLSAYAAGKLDLELPVGMRELYNRIVALGFSVPEPDHTAAGDVATTRAIYSILNGMKRNDDAQSTNLSDV